MGGGEHIVRTIDAGNVKLDLLTLAIALMLLVGSAYAFSGAGVIGHLPLTKYVLMAVSAIYIARGVGFPHLPQTLMQLVRCIFVACLRRQKLTKMPKATLLVKQYLLRKITISTVSSVDEHNLDRRISHTACSNLRVSLHHQYVERIRNTLIKFKLQHA